MMMEPQLKLVERMEERNGSCDYRQLLSKSVMVRVKHQNEMAAKGVLVSRDFSKLVVIEHIYI